MESGRFLTAVVRGAHNWGVILLLFLSEFGTGEGDALDSLKNGEKLWKQK